MRVTIDFGGCNCECGAHSMFADGYGEQHLYCAKAHREIHHFGDNSDFKGVYPPGDHRNFPEWCPLIKKVKEDAEQCLNS